LKGKITGANKIFESTFGYKLKEVKGKNLTAMLKEKYSGSEDYDKLWEDLRKGIHQTGTFEYVGKDNKKVFVQGTYTAIKDRRDKTFKIFLIGFDTTELVKTSEELRARETELSFQLEELQLLQEKLKGK
jgi:methyl-accepting chemotaxis protein